MLFKSASSYFAAKSKLWLKQSFGGFYYHTKGLNFRWCLILCVQQFQLVVVSISWRTTFFGLAKNGKRQIRSQIIPFFILSAVRCTLLYKPYVSYSLIGIITFFCGEINRIKHLKRHCQWDDQSETFYYCFYNCTAQLRWPSPIDQNCHHLSKVYQLTSLRMHLAQNQFGNAQWQADLIKTNKLIKTQNSKTFKSFFLVI